MALSFFGKFLSIINKWRGKAVDFDKVYWYQCVDWAKQFVLEQYGITLGSFSGSALNGWNTGSPFNSNWIRVSYKNGLVPEIWDVVFLNKTKSNPYGHVCIADNGCDSSHLCVIEENAWTGNGDWKWGNVVTKRTLAYRSASRGDCLWWYHRK